MKEKKGRLIIEGNAFYEIDEECLKRKEKKEPRMTEQKKKNRKQR